MPREVNPRIHVNERDYPLQDHHIQYAEGNREIGLSDRTKEKQKEPGKSPVLFDCHDIFKGLAAEASLLSQTLYQDSTALRKAHRDYSAHAFQDCCVQYKDPDPSSSASASISLITHWFPLISQVSPL